MLLANLSIFLPLISSLFAGSASLQENKKLLTIFSSLIMVAATTSAVFLGIEVIFQQKLLNYTLLEWIAINDFKVNWGFKIDVLSVSMIFVVNLVSTIVHIYSLGYMREDKRVNRFVSYLSLFTFFMLILVSSDNLLQLFVGWEGVGLCSYLLIGFWYKKDSANKAAIKAFITNRIGDFAFLVGIVAIYMLFGSLNFDQIFNQVEASKDVVIGILGLKINYLDFICMALFIGCMGKSAQLGLHVWLPDAMEGPTPVSALIHAATMVTAGVFLVIRCSYLFEYSDITLWFMTIIGALTCIFAATIAITQNDIKRVIAYSTCSQLGYMFFACGVSAYSAGMFHLVTHAFFKALLFLTAGNVIHALHHEQNMQKMGGIWKKLPLTYILVWFGSLAIAGIPPFAGFYSKDVILESAFMSHSSHGLTAYILGLVAAFLTAFYSWRLIYLTFHGETKPKQKVEKVPFIMSLPLIILGLGAVFSGIIGYKILHVADASHSFWLGSIFVKEANNVLSEIHHTPPIIKYLPLIVAIFGIIMASFYYAYNRNLPKNTMNSFYSLYRFFHNKWYFDEFYQRFILNQYARFSKFCSKEFDNKIIDGYGPIGAGKLVKSLAKKTSKIHNGFIYRYSFSYIFGLVIMLSWLIFKVLS